MHSKVKTRHELEFIYFGLRIVSKAYFHSKG
jgi:hypothetical protein